MAALSALASAIHAWVAPEHLGASWEHSGFFAFLAAAQAVLAVAAPRWPRRALLLAGMAGNVMVVALYAASRVAGIPGLGGHGPEPVEPLGLAATAAEAGTVALLGVLLMRRRRSAEFRTVLRPPKLASPRAWGGSRRLWLSLAMLALLAAIGTARGATWEGQIEAREEARGSAASPGQHGHGQEPAAASAALADPADSGPMATQSAAASGLQVAFSVGPIRDVAGVAAVAAGKTANVRIAVTDAVTGSPANLEERPAVWLDRKKASLGAERSQGTLSCQDKIRLYAQGTLGYRPDVDLNSYLILALNSDATISVIDPLGGVSGVTQLYSAVFLRKPGEDWAATGDGKRLFVSMPAANQVAAIETDTFKVLKNIDAGDNPTRVAVQPGGRFIWVGNDGPDRKSGVTVIDAASLQVAARIPTGRGRHEIAFSDDARHALITNSAEGSVSVIDGRRLKKMADIRTGGAPLSVAFSPAAGAAYVADLSGGSVAVIDLSSLKLAARINAGGRIQDFRLSHDGLWGFALDGASGRLHVIDVLAGRVVSSLEVVEHPDQMAVTHSAVYVRSHASPEVSIVDLAKLGRSEDLTVLRVVVGQGAPSDVPFLSSADAIVPVHEHEGHVLVASPADRYIYLTMAGMQAPMAGFQNYGKVPRALRVLDRSIRALGPGEYGAEVPIPRAGEYQLAFLLAEPRVVECFTFSAAAEGS